MLKQAGDLSGKVIVSCSFPLTADNTELVVAHASSGAEALAKMAPTARVVSAFTTVPSEVLFSVFEAKGNAIGPSLVYCGDDRSGQRVAAERIRDVGFDPVEAGPLQMARYTEPLALLVGHLAYGGRGARTRVPIRVVRQVGLAGYMAVPSIHEVPEEEYEVTPLELFFDLVFVFAVSQLS